MKIGVPSEVKNNENRVGLTPDSVRVLTNLVIKFLFNQMLVGQ
jgi:alanine dehydrogenase